MSNNVPDILKQLDDLNKQSGIEVFVPSLKRTIKVKPLNLRQQKELLKSSIEETLTKLSFNINFYNILQENAIDTINVNSLYVFDRIAIAIALRSASLDSSYTLDENKINLNDKITEYPAITLQPEAVSGSIDLQNLTVALEAPKLGVDRDISSTVLNKFRAAGTDDIKTIVGELFINEIIKFIKSVTFKTDEGENTIDFSTIKLDVKLSIAEKFPATLTNQILDFIKTYRDFEGQFTKVGDSNIEVDGSFFAI